MKQLIFLCTTLLCLGCLLPLLSYGGYQLAIGANGTVDTGTNGSATDSPQALADFWNIDNSTTSGGGDGGDSDSDSDDTNTNDSNNTTTNSSNEPNQTTTDSNTQTTTQNSATLAPLLLWDESSSAVLTVSVRDYLIGAVASELAMTWPDEALKAQAVACHSYILYCKEHVDTTALDGAYLSVDPARRQGYMTDEVLQSYWGDAYTENYARLSALVDEVLNIVVLYDGEAAATTYYAISNGTTETSEAVWGEALPYLTSVSSAEDANADGYYASVNYTIAQIESIFYTNFGISAENAKIIDCFGDITYDAAGYVREIEICGYAIAGTTFRNAFSLRSSCFWVQYESDGSISFCTLGYGHGVGLSQWGAKFRADAGETYDEILAHYYPGTTLGTL